jgi:magnesium chelatase subunit I
MSEDIRKFVESGNSVKIAKKKVAMIDLPLGATEDRVCGTIDIEKALTEGIKAFEPGLLAKANRGILYVDEVNLLDDHLVDILLDSAASGWNTVEREGISIRHPARFVLVGSGNPEEGELRPQLLDRFGMHSEIKTVREPELRVQIVEQRSEFDKNPSKCLEQYKDQQQEFRDRIVKAQNLLGQTTISYELRVKISQVCGELDVDGLRGDIVTNRAARAYATYMGRTEVTTSDIAAIIKMCLRHRLRKDPLESIDSGDKVQKVFESIFDELLN